MILDLFMTIFEDFLITYFLFSYFFEEKKLKETFIVGSICVGETFVFDHYFLGNEFLFILLISTWAIYLIMLKKKANLLFFVIPCLLMGLLLVSNISSYYFVSLIFHVKIHDISTITSLTMISIILSKVIFLVASFWLYSKLTTFKVKNTDFFELKSFIVFIICLFLIIATLEQSIVYGSFDYASLIILVFEFIIMCISSIMLYINIQQNDFKKLELQAQINELKYSKELYFETCQLSYQFSREKHRLYYMLKQIETISLQENCSNIHLIEKVLTEIEKMDISYTSDNPVYDYMMTKKISELKHLDFDVVYTANISEISILNDSILIDNMKEYIDMLSSDLSTHKNEKNHFIINVLEKNDYIVFEIVVDRYVELPNDIFELTEKSNYIVKENMTHFHNWSSLKVLIKK